MSKLNYSFYLMKFISKKWGLYLSTLVSFSVIISIYIITIISVEDDAKTLVGLDANYATMIESGLVSKPLNLVIVFLSLIPFIVYLAYSIFNSDNSTMLIIFTKQANRSVVIFQRIVIGLAVILMNSFIYWIAFAIVAQKDNVLSTSDSIKWSSSMFVGCFIASIFLFFLTLLIMNFAKILPTLLIVSGLACAFPIITLTLTADTKDIENEYISHLLDEDKLNTARVMTIGPYDEASDRLWDESRAVHNSNVVSSPTIVDHYFHFDYKASEHDYHLGAKRKIPKPKYVQYAKWDSWSAVTSIFNIWTHNKSGQRIRHTWTDTKKLKDIIPLDDKNSILIGDKRYLFFRPTYTTSANIWEEHSWAEHNFMHSINHSNGQIVMSNEKIDSWDSQWQPQSSHTVDVEGAIANYNAFIQSLKTNDAIAHEYKGLSFAEQGALFELLISYYDDKTMQPENIFHSIKNRLDDVTSFKNYSLFGMINAFKIDNYNTGRFSPNKMFPDTYFWKQHVLDYEMFNQYTSFPSNHISQYKTMMTGDDEVFIPHYNEELNAGDYIMVVWLTLFVLIIPISIFAYSRKDFN